MMNLRVKALLFFLPAVLLLLSITVGVCLGGVPPEKLIYPGKVWHNEMVNKANSNAPKKKVKNKYVINKYVENKKVRVGNSGGAETMATFVSSEDYFLYGSYLRVGHNSLKEVFSYYGGRGIEKCPVETWCAGTEDGENIAVVSYPEIGLSFVVYLSGKRPIRKIIVYEPVRSLRAPPGIMLK